MQKFILIIPVVLVAGFVFLFAGETTEAEDITWGANFSAKQAEELGLDWKETYLALLGDLNVKELRVAAHWDLLEPADRGFFFEDVDWQMQKAAEHGAKVLLAIGMKTPRWPECHIPEWAKELSTEELRAQVLALLKETVMRYKTHEALFAWQVENEPLFPFGECPWRDFSFLQKEVELVQSLDSGHSIFTSDSGELSLWWNAARLGDKVAVTLYRKAWFEDLNTYIPFPLPAVFYQRKAWLVEKLFGKEVIVGELQAEPWTPEDLRVSTFQEQEKTMNLSRLKDTIAFAKRTGLKTFYLWGAEWWYWMREIYNQPEIWNEAKKLFEA